MKILTIDYTDPDAGKKLVQSLRDTGFAVIKNHFISPDLIKTVYTEWELFFNKETKNEYLFNSESQAGYFPFKTENAKGYSVKDLKEFYHVYDKKSIPVGLQKDTWKLRNELNLIGETLLQWIQDNLPEDVKSKFSQSLPSMVEDSPKTLFRILHYPALPSDVEEGAVRAYEHYDIDLLTVLLTAAGPGGEQKKGATSGLEVKGLDGKWYAVKSDPNSIIINCGDMLQLATEGYLKSTAHKVVNPLGDSSKVSRYSCPLFIHPKEEVLLSSDKTAKEFLDERLREIGLKK